MFLGTHQHGGVAHDFLAPCGTGRLVQRLVALHQRAAAGVLAQAAEPLNVVLDQVDQPLDDVDLPGALCNKLLNSQIYLLPILA